MKASVLITVYNLERYIDSALASALVQEGTCEILVVDDASSDGSHAALAQHADSITVIRNDRNLGVLRSTIAGLRRARGDIVCFLDGDDIWAPAKVKSVVGAFKRDPGAVLVSHDYRFIDAAGRVIREHDPTQTPIQRLVDTDDIGGISALMRSSVLEYRGNVWLGSAYSIRRDALDLDAFEAWCEELPAPELVYQDHPLASFLLLTSGGGCGYVNAKLLNYRVHETSYSTGASNLSRAMAIVRKGAATREATSALVRKFSPVGAPENAAQLAGLVEYEYLHALYSGQRTPAMRKYLAGARKRLGCPPTPERGRATCCSTRDRARTLLCYEVIP